MENIIQERKKEYEKLLISKSFQRKEHIYSTYNESIAYYKKYRKAAELLHAKEAADNLSIAAMKLAVVVEWSAKNLVYIYFKNKMQLYGITHPDYEKWEKIINFKNLNTGRNMSTHDLFLLIRDCYQTEILNGQVVIDNLDDKGIRETLINGYKHEGTIPNATSYILTLNETYYFLKNLLIKQDNIHLDSITDSYPDSWEELFFSCDYFIPEKNRHFVLLTDEIESMEIIENIFKIDWDLVLDFSYQSEEEGRVSLYDQYQSLKEHRGVNLKYLCDFKSNEMLPALAQGYWIKLNGRQDSLNENDRILEDRDLARSYVKKNFLSFLNAFTSEYTLPVDIIVLNCARYKNSTFRIIEQFDDKYYRDQALTVHIMNCENNFLTDKIEMGDLYSGKDIFKRYSLTIEQLSTAICNNCKYSFVSSDLAINIPHSSQGRGVIELEEYQNMKSVLDLVYIGIEKQYEKETQSDRANKFLHGESKADWDLLDNEECVIPQVNESMIKDEINKGILENRRSIYVIDYQAGVGGTTFLRRLAFQFHKQYPTVIMARYIETTTVEYLLEIYRQSFKGIIILVDSNDISYNETLKLQEELGQKSEFTYEIVYIARKDLLLEEDNEKTKVYLHLTRLNHRQCLRMQKNLDQYITNEKCRANLEKCVNKDQLMDEEHIPFVLSMYAFDEEFNGIADYVKHSLDNLSERERDIIFVLSLAGFANYRVDIQYFRAVYGETTVRLMNRGDYRLNPLIYRISDNTSKKQGYQIRYSLFIKDILKYYSGGKKILFNNLLDRILSIIKESRSDIYCRENADIVKLLNKLFIERTDKQEGDYDVKGTYSPLISKLIEESRANNDKEYDGSENAVVKIFKSLTSTYPEEPHFAAHLARYYFYNTNNYSKGFDTIKEAIQTAESIEGMSMGSLYHIKAMGYSARIQNDFIKTIRGSLRHYKKDNESNVDISHIKEVLSLIDADMQNAAYNFNISRYESKSRFISNIAECRLLLKIQALYDELKEFCISNNLECMVGDYKTVSIFDKVESMIEDCEKMLAVEKGEINSYNAGLLKNIQENKMLAKANGNEICDVCKQLMETGTADIVVVARRKLARINYNEICGNFDIPESQNKLQEIVHMMEENFEEDITNNANFRIWFNALRYLETSDVETTLEDILTKLERWTSEPNASADAFYYKYIVRFILAYEQNTLEHDAKVREELQKMLSDLKQVAAKLPRKTIPFEWFSDYQKGLRRLISSSELATMNRTNAVASLRMFRGILPSKDYFKTRTAYISYKGLPVYFNPQSIIDRITASSENKYVQFGIGFSYDGLRSYHDSIELYKGNIVPDTKLELRKGLEVQAVVKYFNDTYVVADIIGTQGCTVGIKYQDLKAEGYDRDNRPEVGRIFRVRLLGDKILANGKKVWDGTTKLSEKSDGSFNRPFANIKLGF